ncbi:hypothetical protein DWZ57_10720, partial [Bacteroides fragilis]
LLPIKYEKSLFSSLYITLSHIASVRGKSVAYLINKLFSNYFLIIFQKLCKLSIAILNSYPLPQKEEIAHYPIIH